MVFHRYIWYVVLAVIPIFQSCEEDKNEYFTISSDRVGLLSRDSTLEDVAQLFAADSIVSDTLKSSFGSANNKLKIFEKGGKHLLTITPDTDSIQKIGHILIVDPRFKTEEGIGLQSTFQDIKEHLEIDKIVTSLNNVVVLLRDSDIYFTIDKKELPAHLRYTKSRPVELVEIPDQARFKYFMVSWD